MSGKAPGCPVRPGTRSALAGQGSAVAPRPVKGRDRPVRPGEGSVLSGEGPAMSRRGQRRPVRVRQCPGGVAGGAAGPPGGAGVSPVPPGPVRCRRRQPAEGAGLVWGRDLQGGVAEAQPPWGRGLCLIGVVYTGAWPRFWRGPRSIEAWPGMSITSQGRVSMNGGGGRGLCRGGVTGAGTSQWRAARAGHAGSCSPPFTARTGTKGCTRGTPGVVV